MITQARRDHALGERAGQLFAGQLVVDQKHCNREFILGQLALLTDIGQVPVAKFA